MPIYSYTLLDYSLRRTSLNMTAQLHGMFFLAESQWPTNPDAVPPPPELTCYRRNLFQITGTVTLPRTLRYIMTDQGDRIPIFTQELTVSAIETVEGNPVRIISVPWKNAAGSATNTEDKVEREPASIPLDTMSSSDFDTDYATFPIQWKRLQFRIATANNGRRKELQQHFVLMLRIMATLSTGARVSIAEAQSGAIIVRGRSPRNFQSRKDLPLSTSAGLSRKGVGAGMSRTSTGDSVPQAPTSKPAVSPDEVPQVVFPQQESRDLQPTTPELNEWTQMPHPIIPEPLPTPDYKNSMMPPQFPPYIKSSPSEVASTMAFANPNLSALNGPVSLSLSSDDESSPVTRSARPSLPRAPTSNPSPSLAKTTKSRSAPIPSPPPPPLQSPPRQRPKLNSQNTSSSSANSPKRISSTQGATRPSTASSTSPVQKEGPDPADTLYEYFPLGLDDWIPPVDAVYRPYMYYQHQQHTSSIRKDGFSVETGSRGLGRARSKRMFNADD